MRVPLTFFMLVSACAAQTALLQGELVSEKLVDRSSFEVRLETNSPGIAETAPVSFDGAFSFGKVPAGTYTLRVVNLAGDEVASQLITVHSSNPTLLVKLPEPPSVRPTGASVSVARLRHKPAPQALRALANAQHFSEAGDYQRAATELEKSVGFDADFFEARVNLGAQYTRLGKFEQAVAEFQRAIALDPSNDTAQSNLALALYKLGRFTEAEQWARNAVQLAPANATNQYVLACVLARNPATVAESFHHMEIAARTMPLARAALAAYKR